MVDSWAERAQKHYEAAGRWAVALEEEDGLAEGNHAYKMAELSIGLGILADHLSRPDVLAELIDLRTRLTTTVDMVEALLASIGGFPVMTVEDHRKDLELLRKLIRGEQP